MLGMVLGTALEMALGMALEEAQGVAAEVAGPAVRVAVMEPPARLGMAPLPPLVLALMASPPVWVLASARTAWAPA